MSPNGASFGIRNMKFNRYAGGTGRILFLILLFLALLLPAEDLSAMTRKIQGPVNIESDFLDYRKDEDTYFARGNVIIRFTDGVLEADRVSLNKATNEALAEGHVVLKSGGDILQGDTLRFNIETKSGATENGRIFMVRNNVYLKGARIEKEGEAHYRIFDGKVTTCDGEIRNGASRARKWL